MEVIMPPLNPTDFNFNFNSSTYPTAPSTPRLIAPTSPSSLSELYREFDQLLIMDDDDTHSRATVPFAWEEKPGVPKPTTNLLEQDFAFDVSSQILSSVRSAEHLFHHGMIKPVEIIEINKERDLRGRERINSSSRSRRTRSLPPLIRDSEQQQRRQQQQEPDTKPTMFGSGKGSKKWSFKDLFLFRSASDGRALDRDPLKKYSGAFRKHDEGLRNSSLRDRSGPGSKRRRGVSAHELHYTVNRAVSNDMKKKTFLPYKQGILGRLAFNPTVHALSNGSGFSHNN